MRLQTLKDINIKNIVKAHRLWRYKSKMQRKLPLNSKMKESVLILSRSEMQKYGLSHGEEAVLSALRYVSKDGMWEGSYAALSRLACFVSPKTLYRTVYRLVDKGFILIEEKGHKTVFVIGQNDLRNGQNDTAIGQNDTSIGQNVQERKKKNQKEIKKEEKNNIYIFNQNKDKGKNIETAAGNFEIKINKPSGVNEVAEYCRSHAKLFNMEACKEYYYYNEGRGWKGVTDWHYDFAYHYNKIRRRIEREQSKVERNNYGY